MTSRPLSEKQWIPHLRCERPPRRAKSRKGKRRGGFRVSRQIFKLLRAGCRNVFSQPFRRAYTRGGTRFVMPQTSSYPIVSVTVATSSAKISSFAVTPEQRCDIPDFGFRNIRNIGRQLIHADPADDRSLFSVYEHMRLIRDDTRNSVRISRATVATLLRQSAVYVQPEADTVPASIVLT